MLAAAVDAINSTVEYKPSPAVVCLCDVSNNAVTNQLDFETSIAKQSVTGVH